MQCLRLHIEGPEVYFARQRGDVIDLKNSNLVLRGTVADARAHSVEAFSNDTIATLHSRLAITLELDSGASRRPKDVWDDAHACIRADADPVKRGPRCRTRARFGR